MTRRFASAALALVLLAAPASAQTSTANVAPSVGGFTANGTIVLRGAVQGSPITLGGPIVVERRDALYRFDLQSLQLPGLDATLAAALGSVLNQGGATVVYDGATGSTRAWANGSRTYYLDEKTPVRGVPRAPATATAAPSDPLAMLGALTRAGRDLQTASFAVDLTGHGQVNGHPATSMNVAIRRKLATGREDAARGSFAFADDLEGTPLQASVEGTGGALAGYAMKIDLTTVTAAVPAAADFTAPTGYRRVNSLGEILRPPGL